MKKLVAILAIMVILVSLLPGCTSNPEKQLKQMGYEISPQGFLQSVQKGDPAAVSLFLAAKVSPDTRNDEGLTALMVAAEAGHFDVVKVLIDNKADVNAVNYENGWSALHFAASRGHVDIAQYLLFKGASISPEWFMTREAAAIFHAAVKTGEVDRARWYIQQGVDPGLSYYYDSALTVAAQNEDIAMLQMLIEESTCIDNYALASPLMTAAYVGNIDIARLLLDLGADVNLRTDFGTPINAAVRNNHLEVVKFLISRGAYVDSLGHFGETPLIVASDHGNIDMVRLLLSEGANVNASTQWFFGEEGQLKVSPLMLAERNGHSEVVQIIRAAGAK